MKMIDLTCARCEKRFQKETKEFTRQTKKGKTKFFCSLSCFCFARNEIHPPKGNIQNLVSNNRKDEYTPYRWFVLRAEHRAKNKNRDCNITVEFLKELWGKQKGICPLSGWELNLPKDTRIGWKTSDPKNASLDRVDSSKGYVEGNVRFIAVMANFCKQVFTDEDVINFCKAVTRNHPCPT